MISDPDEWAARDPFAAWVAVYDAAIAAASSAVITGKGVDWHALDPDSLMTRSERTAVEQIAKQRVEGYEPTAY